MTFGNLGAVQGLSKFKDFFLERPRIPNQARFFGKVQGVQGLLFEKIEVQGLSKTEKLPKVQGLKTPIDHPGQR